MYIHTYVAYHGRIYSTVSKRHEKRNLELLYLCACMYKDTKSFVETAVVMYEEDKSREYWPRNDKRMKRRIV